MNIGIDIGTTYCKMAVKGRVAMAPGYPPGRYLEDLDVTILPDPAGDHTVPSVFWWHPDEPERYVVGHEALHMTGDGKVPIRFAKKALGTTRRFMMNGRGFLACEVATHILRYLKQWAEIVTGQQIHSAVITYPAYFTSCQREEMLQAAMDAGFHITSELLIMDSYATALAYTSKEDRRNKPCDDLRVLIYDLGGGTFEVALMEKIEGVIYMREFDSEPLIGGHYFDKALAQWIHDQLTAQGRVIPFDEGNQERLLRVAENAKLQLSMRRTPRVKVFFGVDFLIDDKGQRVQFNGSINDLEYAELIQEELRRTLACCCRVLAAGHPKPDELPRRTTVLLVGASTWDPWVQNIANDMISWLREGWLWGGSEWFESERFEPDYCVAAGAALMAAQLPANIRSNAIGESSPE